MIISASYKTDIPAFYGEWFSNRLRAGYCKTVNPYNQRFSHVDLNYGQVDGFVFWTKNLSPFFKHLAETRERGFSFIVQYCINNYDRTIEPFIVDYSKSIENMQKLADIYGKKVGVWRYDPILFSSLTPIDFHRRNFEKLAKSLAGTTDEVVISFAQLYKKTLKNINEAAREYKFFWEDPTDEYKYNFTSELYQIAKSYGLQLSICSQKQFLVPNVTGAKCIDAKRLSEVSGKTIYVEQKGNRSDCECFLAKDIGEYNTCPHGCLYCYAVQNRNIAKARYKQHNPEGEFLLAPKDCSDKKISKPVQGNLFS